MKLFIPYLIWAAITVLIEILVYLNCYEPDILKASDKQAMQEINRTYLILWVISSFLSGVFAQIIIPIAFKN